jgi:hypothetical protein
MLAAASEADMIAVAGPRRRHTMPCNVSSLRLQVSRILKRHGASQDHKPQAVAHGGDIVAIAGLSQAAVGCTIAAPEVGEALQPGRVDPPTLSMTIGANTSPIGRAAGNEVTSQKIAERLFAEAARSVSLQVSKAPASGAAGDERLEVRARGELHLSLIIETMRRDGFELELAAPRVLLKRGRAAATGGDGGDGEGVGADAREVGGPLLEPLEEVTLEVPTECSGAAAAVVVVLFFADGHSCARRLHPGCDQRASGYLSLTQFQTFP